MFKLPQLRVLIDDEPRAGAWNMAVDEVLLESAVERGVAALRFYRWCEPTASLGHFQRESDFRAEPRFSHLPAVRRLSGGGTLIHDRELTYSLVLPASQQVVAQPVELYGLVHRIFIAVLQARGVEVAMRGTTVSLKQEPLLCFAREDEHDLVAFGHKLLGSAQRRRRGAVLQHGGLVLEASHVTPELPGIVNLCPQSSLSGLATDLSMQLCTALSANHNPDQLTEGEQSRAVQLASEVYASMRGHETSSAVVKK